VKLADFGLSKRLTDTTAYYTRGGTQSYMAPEILNFLSIGADYTNAVDIWATGCIAYRLVAGVVPFPPGPSLMRYCEDKSRFPYDPLLDCDLKKNGFNFLRQLLVPHPKDRPSASESLKNDWILSGLTRRYSSEIMRRSEEGSRSSDPSQIDFNSSSHVGLKSFVPFTEGGSMTTLAAPTEANSRNANARAQNAEQNFKLPLSHNLPAEVNFEPPVLLTPQKQLRYQVYLKLPAILKGHSGSVQGVAFSPDGTQIASAEGGDGRVRLWDAATGAVGLVLKDHSGWVRGVAFSPDGTQIASAGGDGTVRFWDAATGAAGLVLKGHSGWVRGVAFSPDGTQIASAGGGDGRVRLWDAATGAAGLVLKGHSGSV